MWREDGEFVFLLLLLPLPPLHLSQLSSLCSPSSLCCFCSSLKLPSCQQFLRFLLFFFFLIAPFKWSEPAAEPGFDQICMNWISCCWLIRHRIRVTWATICLWTEPPQRTATVTPRLARARPTSSPRGLVKRRNFLFSLLARVVRVGVLTSAAKSSWSQSGLTPAVWTGWLEKRNSEFRIPWLIDRFFLRLKIQLTYLPLYKHIYETKKTNKKKLQI